MKVYVKNEGLMSLECCEQYSCFLLNPKVSQELPYMRTVKKPQQRFLMKISLQKAYEVWKLENPENNVASFPVFS